ncbi:Hypothetical protein NTJ_09757 [Nesidiocoris tenuis]|uniref:HAT C-terminal dimerisation domain-containing protein n=1 Tax=Nesidiocoris tenuis TaxID=355587 RepID=A0ABN7B041_9HEMI|nr:Hypothetical protein NTJ_09757 [Nesidiocoris tenuis]
MNVSDLDSNGSVDSDYEEALVYAEKSEEATQIDNARAGEDHSSEISRTGLRHRMVIVDGKFYSYITERSNDRKVVAACKKCEPKVVEISGKPFVTSNFVKHLRNAHGAETVAEYKAYLQQKKLKVKGGASTRKRPQKIDLNQTDFGHLISKYIVSAMIPFRAVEDPHFVKIFKKLHVESYGLKLPNRATVVKIIRRLYEKNQETLINILRETEHVCATADIWSGKKRSFLGVTVHWLDSNNCERHSAAIACRRFKNAHTHITVAAMLRSIFADFGLNQKKIVAVVTDNGSNFLKAFKKFGIKSTVLQYDDPYVFPDDGENLHVDENVSSSAESDPGQSSDSELNSGDKINELGPPRNINDLEKLPNHLRCCSHTLNLCAVADLKKLLAANKVYGNLHRSVMTKCSVLWHQASRPKSAEVIQDILGHTLSGPGITRWNSLYDSMKQISKIRTKCPDVSKALKIKTQQCMTDEDFAYIEEYIECSKPLAELLDLLQGEKNVYFGNFIPSLYSLRRKLQLLVGKDWKYCGPLAQTYVESVQKRFEDYFTFSSPMAEVAAVAAIAHPAHKNRWLQLVNIEHHSKLLQNFTSAVANEIADSASCRRSPMSSSATLTGASTSSFVAYCDFDDFDSASSERDSMAKAQEQIFMFFAENSKELRILDTYTAVKRVFLKTNVVLPSSAAVERLFSFATMTNAPRSNRLSDKNFESRVILKANGFKF